MGSIGDVPQIRRFRDGNWGLTTVTNAATTFSTVTHNPVCCRLLRPTHRRTSNPTSPSGCKPATQLGWFLPLPGSGTDAALDEQIVFDPIVSADGEFIVSTLIPANTSALLCKIQTPTGFTMAGRPCRFSPSPT
jgi:hypothetical protein